MIGDARRRDEAERVDRRDRLLDGKLVIVAKAEGVAALLVLFDLAETSLANARSCGTARKLREIARRAVAIGPKLRR